jgi:non-ribosomal peptide synthetase component F/alpha-ketoglutarate-dependent taurine dioxygenase/aryl carrier-like protein
VWELFGALLHGGRLVVVPYLVSRSPDAFYELLQREHVTVLNQTPSAFEQLIQAEERAESDTGLALRLVIFGGEALDFQSLRPWFARHGDQKPQLVNMYGITETTVHVTYRPITQQDVTGRGSLLGVPIPDLQVHLLDAHLEPVPIGVPGELYVGGAGLARGYLNRPELTANRFIHPPFASDPRARLYKSGDLARYRSDGELEYLGRIDHQVKIRGFRVELGEIESVLDSHPGVRVSVVRVLDDQSGHKRLVAYVVPDTGASPTVHELRALVRSVLPEYMVPAAFVTLDALPLTPNGKIDRRALPLPVVSPTGGQTAARVAPRTPVEHAIAQVWAGVLGFSAEQLSVDDNFFDLGGHSLIAMQVTARLRDALGLDVPVRSIFEHPTIAGLADDVEIARARATPSQLPSLVPVARDQPIALSVAQEQLWFLDQLQPGLHAYNMPEALRLRGPVNIQALERSLQDLGERHESLRTTFMATDGKPFQVIASHCELPLAIVDLGDVPDVNRDTTLAGLVDAEIRRPFDLATGPLLRTTLIRLGEDDHVLLLIAHHIVSDGWSQSVLWRELGVLYEAHAAGHTPVLPPVTTQYADYARWQREWLSSREGQEQIAYWKRQMLGAPALLPLPTDRPRSGSRSFAGAKQSQTLSRATVRQIKTLTQQEGATLFMTLLAAFDTLLLRYTRTTDIVVGTDVANRQLVETEGIVGFFVNNVIMRTDMSGDPTFRELLGRVREVALAAYAHQEVPFGTLVDVLKPPRSLGHSPLCQVLFVLQNTPASALSVRGVEVTPIDVDMRTSKFDVAVFVVEVEEQLEVTWVYRTDLFDAPTIRRAMDHFALLLESAAANPAVPLSKLTMATEAERSQRMQAETERPVTTSLKGARRRAVNLGEIKSVKTSFLAEGDTFPLVVQPEIADVSLAEWARSSHEFIESSLLKHGALLFRGFGLKSLADFEQFVESICPELFDEYGDLPREGASGKIYKSTPYPNNLPILFHNESSHMHQWPRKIWFHCVVAAERGGETPLVDCRTIYNALDPAIRDRFAEKGLMYVRNYTDGLDVSWEDFFQTSNRSAVEEYCRKASIDFEWKGEHGLRTTQLCPAVVRHPKTNEPIFFNQIQLHHVSCLEPAVRESLTEMFREEDLPRNVYYGDGTAIPDALVQEMVDLYWRTSVAPPWQPGDVIMLDNMLVAHARNPFEGARKIVVAMGELIHKAGVITIAPHA